MRWASSSAVGDLERDAHRLFEGQRAALQPLGERLALDQLQHQVGRAVDQLEAVDRGDVRVVERGQQSRLALEAAPQLAASSRKASLSALIATSRARTGSKAR